MLACGTVQTLSLQMEFLNYLVLFGQTSNPKIYREVKPQC